MCISDIVYCTNSTKVKVLLRLKEQSVRLMVRVLLTRARVVDGFENSEIEILIWVINHALVGLKKSVTRNCKSCWTKTPHRHNSNLKETYALLNKPFLNEYEHLGNLKNTEVGCLMNLPKSTMRNELTLSLLSRQKRQSFLWKPVTDDEKCIHFENPQCHKHWVDPGQPTP